MAIKINANMALGSAQYLDDRQSVADLDALLALDTNIIPNGFECYVEALDCKYKYHEDYNETSTGNWKLSTGGGGDSSVTLTQEEYEALTEEEKLDGLYYTYDTKRIYKNGVQYGASEPIPLTMEEYTALKEAGAIDEQQEYLVEANTEGILLGAEDIGYNNAESDIQATTVQGAIDNVVEKVDGLISDTTSSTTSTWSSKKTSDEIAKVETELKGNIEELSSNLGENVPPTSIAFNTDYITENDTSILMYEIRNGICYVTMDVTSVVSADGGRVVCTLPKPSSQMQFTIPPFNSQSTIRVGAILFANGNLSFFSLEAGQRYMFSFSYPVAQPSSVKCNIMTEQKLDATDKLGGLIFSASGTTLTITDGTNTWILEANS